jgi:Fe-S-cluster containining protein
MSIRELPVLNFAPFRKYPTKQDQQEFADDEEVCHYCVSSACCQNQDAISLTSFDIFRLAAFFNQTPAEFMLNFTQDRFEGEDDWKRRAWNDDPNSSTVTWLRRRENLASSPCIFLKYIRDADGTPRRICSIHDARPISCREFYFSTCKKRGSGELAALLAEGFEKVRDGEITETRVDAELERFKNHDFETATFAESLEYSFWVEMKCVINLEQANVEGSNSYEMADYQDPIDEKLNRVISAKNLRCEEDYGPRPHAEQLMPYTSGLSFAGSPEYERIMKVLRTPPSSGIFGLGNYPYYIGARTLVPGVKPAGLFPTIPDKEVAAFLAQVPLSRLFPQHDLTEVRRLTQRDVYAGVLKGYNHLIRFASHVAALDPILEWDPPGTIERELFSMLVSFETSLNPYIAHNPYLQPVKHHLARVTIELLEQKLAAATTPDEVFDCLRSSFPLQMVRATLSPALRRRAKAVNDTIHAKLRKNRSDLYLSSENPVEARRMAGKRLAGRAGRQAWSEWSQQMLDMRYAATAGFKRINLSAFYRRTLNDLEKLPFRQSYATSLSKTVKHLAYSMTSDNRIAYQAMPYRDAADRLAAYAIRLFNWMEEKGNENHSCEVTAEFLIVYRSLGLSYHQDRSFGLIVHRLLESQLPDGSWETNPTPENQPESQGEYWKIMYRVTWACLNGLRPLRNDVLNAGNAALDLI